MLDIELDILTEKMFHISYDIWYILKLNRSQFIYLHSALEFPNKNADIFSSVKKLEVARYPPMVEIQSLNFFPWGTCFIK